jgi:hypothetical protein
MTTKVKYIFLVVGVITLFFIDYHSLSIKHNYTQYLLLVGSCIGYIGVSISNNTFDKVKYVTKLSKIIQICGYIFLIIGVLTLIFLKFDVNSGFYFSLLSCFLSVIAISVSIYAKNKKNRFEK